MPTDNIIEPLTPSDSSPLVESVATYTIKGGFWGIGAKLSDGSVTVTGVTNNDVLYNNYGRHGHDSNQDAAHYGPTGDGIGFFSTKKWDSTMRTLYKFGIKNGKVGFWDAMTTTDFMDGNAAYSLRMCSLFDFEKPIVPIIDPTAQTYSNTIDVTITNPNLNEFGKLQYSKDGGATWLDYSTPITLSGTTTIMARIVNGDKTSDVVSKTYTLVVPTVYTETTLSDLVATGTQGGDYKVTGNGLKAVAHFTTQGGDKYLVVTDNDDAVVNFMTDKDAIPT